MADTKISDLTAVTDVISTDEYVLARSGFSKKITAADLFAGSGTVGYGTSLPGSPADADEYILVDSTTAPTYQWRFRYNSSNASSYKWEFVGGTEAFVSGGSSLETITDSVTYHDATTADGDIVLPLAGVYQAAFGAMADCAAPDGSGLVFQAVVNMTDAATTALGLENGWRSINLGTHAMVNQFTISAASKTIRTRYKTASGAGRRGSAWLRVLPVRVA